MRLDSHIHLFAAGFDDAADDRQPELEHYEQLRAGYDIERALVIGYEGQPRHVDNNRYLEGLAAQRSWIRPLAYQRIERPPDPAELARLAAAGFLGISLYAPDRVAAQRLLAWPQTTWRALDEHRMIISLNVALDAIGTLTPVLGACTATDVLISHLGLPGSVDPTRPAGELVERYGALLGLARCPHIGVKASGFYALGPASGPAAERIVHLLLDAFGPQRLYWGSDFSPCLRHGTFDAAAHVPALDALTPTETGQIHGANLARLLADR